MTVDDLELIVLSEEVRASSDEPLSALGGLFLEIGNPSLPSESQWKLCLSEVGYRECFEARPEGASQTDSSRQCHQMETVSLLCNRTSRATV